jgi:hypothetical protein
MRRQCYLPKGAPRLHVITNVATLVITSASAPHEIDVEPRLAQQAHPSFSNTTSATLMEGEPPMVGPRLDGLRQPPRFRNRRRLDKLSRLALTRLALTF